MITGVDLTLTGRGNGRHVKGVSAAEVLLVEVKDKMHLLSAKED